MGVQSEWQASHPPKETPPPQPKGSGGGSSGGNSSTISNLPPSVQQAIKNQQGNQGQVAYGSGSGIGGGRTIKDIERASVGLSQNSLHRLCSLRTNRSILGS